MKRKLVIIILILVNLLNAQIKTENYSKEYLEELKERLFQLYKLREDFSNGIKDSLKEKKYIELLPTTKKELFAIEFLLETDNKILDNYQLDLYRILLDFQFKDKLISKLILKLNKELSCKEKIVESWNLQGDIFADVIQFFEDFVKLKMNSINELIKNISEKEIENFFCLIHSSYAYPPVDDTFYGVLKKFKNERNFKIIRILLRSKFYGEKTKWDELYGLSRKYNYSVDLDDLPEHMQQDVYTALSDRYKGVYVVGDTLFIYDFNKYKDEKYFIINNQD